MVRGSRRKEDRTVKNYFSIALINNEKESRKYRKREKNKTEVEMNGEIANSETIRKESEGCR